MHYFIAISLLIFSSNFIYTENIMSDFKTYEYIWLDGYTPEANMRSKVKATDEDTAPDWSFDGSSTLQAEGGSSDCLLLPVQTYENPNGHDLVMTQVQAADHTTLTLQILELQLQRLLQMSGGLDSNKNFSSPMQRQENHLVGKTEPQENKVSITVV